MSVFFTADNHFGHNNVIKFCNRPFESMEEMTEKLIENWNSVVTAGDLVYVLGDMFWRTFGDNEALTVMKRLRGNKYYIRGNHEELIDSNKAFQSQFVWIRDYAKINGIGKRKVVLSHYAFRVWDGSHRGDYSLYGHSHGELEKSEPRHDLLSTDVGVDCWNYTPVSLETITELMESRKETNKSMTTTFFCSDCKNTMTLTGVFKDNRDCSKCNTKMTIIRD